MKCTIEYIKLGGMLPLVARLTSLKHSFRTTSTMDSVANVCQGGLELTVLKRFVTLSAKREFV
jgi:hypothetical protein